MSLSHDEFKSAASDFEDHIRQKYFLLSKARALAIGVAAITGVISAAYVAQYHYIASKFEEVAAAKGLYEDLDLIQRKAGEIKGMTDGVLQIKHLIIRDDVGERAIEISTFVNKNGNRNDFFQMYDQSGARKLRLTVEAKGNVSCLNFEKSPEGEACFK